MIKKNWKPTMVAQIYLYELKPRLKLHVF